MPLALDSVPGSRNAILAALLGKPQSFVSAYENGQRRVDMLEFLAIVEALKADPLAVLAQIMERRRSSE
jgi:hypothetical protein